MKRNYNYTEKDLKILQVEYLTNNWLDLTQIWYSTQCDLGDQTKTTSNGSVLNIAEVEDIFDL